MANERQRFQPSYVLIEARRIIGSFANVLRENGNPVPGNYGPFGDLRYRGILDDALTQGFNQLGRFRVFRPGVAINLIDRNDGGEKGGQVTTLRGVGLGKLDVNGVFFGDVPAEYFWVASDNEIKVVTPPHSPGAASVKVVWGNRAIEQIVTDETSGEPSEVGYLDQYLAVSSQNVRSANVTSTVLIALNDDATILDDAPVDVYIFLNGNPATPFTDSESPGEGVYRTAMLDGGAAQVAIPALPAGVHQIVAWYNGEEIPYGWQVTGSMDLVLRDAEDNLAPRAIADTFGSPHGTTKTLDVLANDSDGDNDRLTVSIASGPSRGSATANADGTIAYTPNSGASGSDSFVYEVADGFGGTSTATATIFLDNGDPEAFDAVFGSPHGSSMTLDVLDSVYDPDHYCPVEV